MPSAKYCCSRSSLRLAKGSTTIDRRGAPADVETDMARGTIGGAAAGSGYPPGGWPHAFGWLLLRSRTAPPRKTRDAGEPHSGAQFVAAIGSEESASRQVGLRDNN